MKQSLMIAGFISLIVLALSGCIGGDDAASSPAELDSPLDISFTFPEPSERSLQIGEVLVYKGIAIECVDISVYSTSALLAIDGQTMIVTGSEPIKIPFENIFIRLGEISISDLSVSLLLYELW